MAMFNEAKKYIPGGVNSPVRAFGNVGREPFFISHAKGSKIYDTNKNEYIDYVCSWGPCILGHAHPEVISAVKDACDRGLSYGAPTKNETVLAKLIVDAVPSAELVRLVSSGTEAVMSALRVARGFTKRSKIIKFAGNYHGHSDSMLVSAGSGLMTEGIPDSAGVTEGSAKDTLIAEYNNLQSVESFFDLYPDDIACVIVEPVAANMGVVPPKKGFLEGLRMLCDKHNSLLIFDEVITGFRIAYGGATEIFGVMPDIVTLGKIVGGGMPLAAYCGRKDIMSVVAPLGPVYQAGTLSGNPIATTAGIKTLEILRDNPDIYNKINKNAQKLEAVFSEKGLSVNRVGSLLSAFFTDIKVENYADAKTSDTKRFSEYFGNMLKKGIYVAPSSFEAMFVSSAHSNEDIEKTIKAIKESI